MTRKQRGGNRSITYDLSQPRNLAAFQTLMVDEEEEEEAAAARSRSRKAAAAAAAAAGAPQPGRKKKRDKETFFKLKCDAAGSSSAGAGGAPPPPSAAASSSSQQAQLAALRELFGSAADPALLADVLASSGGSLEAATEVLLALLDPSAPVAAAAGCSGASASSSSAAAAAAAERRLQQQQQAAHAVDAGGDGGSGTAWCDLPADVRGTIISHLTPRDLARVASTSIEFRRRANALRAHVKHLALLPGLSYACLRGMVASHTSACVMDFSRFERGIASLDPDELLPQVVAMHKQEAEAALFRGIVAVADGARGDERVTPVTGLVLRGLVGVTDQTLAEALSSMKGLRSVDVSHCPNLTNKSFYALSKYKAAAGAAAAAAAGAGAAAHGSGDDDADGSGSSSDGGGGSSSMRYLLPGSDHDDDETETDDSRSNSSSSSGSEMGEAEAADLQAALAASAAEAAAAAAGDDGGSPDAAPEVQAAGASSPPAAAGTLSNQLLALEIQEAIFHQPPAAGPPAAGFAPPVMEPPPAGATAAAAAAGLRELKLAGNRALMDDGLRQVLQGPLTRHSLTRLDISGCRSVTSAGLIMPPWGMLRELRASRCTRLTEVYIHTPSSHPLADADLSNCHFLRVVDIGLPHLRQLNLSTCRTLYRLRLRCPELTSLSLSHCGELVDLHDDAWLVPRLQQLNLYGCRRASGSQLQAVLDRLPELRWLSVNGCHGIRALHLLRNLQLESVDLSGCRFLAAFSSGSTCLRQLSGAACGRLHSLRLASTHLRALLLPNCSQLTDVQLLPPPPPAMAAAAAPSGPGGSSSSSSSKQAHATSGGRPPLDVKGCGRLSPASRSVLASMLAQA